MFCNRVQSANRVHDPSRSSKVVDFGTVESACGTSYWSSVVTLILFCLELLYAEGHFFVFFSYPIQYPYSGQNFGCSHWSISMMLEFAERETNPEIISEEFQPTEWDWPTLNHTTLHFCL